MSDTIHLKNKEKSQEEVLSLEREFIKKNWRAIYIYIYVSSGDCIFNKNLLSGNRLEEVKNISLFQDLCFSIRYLSTFPVLEINSYNDLFISLFNIPNNNLFAENYFFLNQNINFIWMYHM